MSATKAKRLDALARAQVAGRVLDENLDKKVFEDILDALNLYDANKADPNAEINFKAACERVIDPAYHGDLIDDMWKATKATRNPTVKPCW